jgi:hypothetical protein
MIIGDAAHVRGIETCSSSFRKEAVMKLVVGFIIIAAFLLLAVFLRDDLAAPEANSRARLSVN